MAKKKSRNNRNKANASTTSPLHVAENPTPSSSAVSGQSSEPPAAAAEPVSLPVQEPDTTPVHSTLPTKISPETQKVVALEDTTLHGSQLLNESPPDRAPEANGGVHEHQSHSGGKRTSEFESELVDVIPSASTSVPISEPLIEAGEALTATDSQDDYLNTKQNVNQTNPESINTASIVESSGSYEQRVSTGTKTFFNEQRPLSTERFRPEREPPRHYESDDDDFHQNEHSPLIRTSSRESDGGERVNGMPGRSSFNNRQHEPRQPETWHEWTIQNGLHPRTWERQTYFKAILLSTLVTLIILSLTVFRVQDHIKDVLRYIDSHKRIGAVLFIASYTVACTLFLPASLWTIGAGFLFKPFPLALLIVLAGDVFAAVWSFIFGRYVFYGWVKSMMSNHPKFSALDQVIKDDGWKMVVMLRLTPIPFNLITYFFSITSIRLWTVVWATCIGVLPGSCIGIWIGTLLKGLSGVDNPELETKNVVILVMNGVLVVCSILALSMFGKRSLRKALKRLERHQAISSHQNVEVVVEGVATVIRELEDYAHVPPPLRSSIVEQLAAEEEGRLYYSSGDQSPLLSQDRESNASFSSSPNATTLHNIHRGGQDQAFSSTSQHHQEGSHGYHHRSSGSSGFTRGEKMMFILISVVAVVNVCVCVPLYFHYASSS